MPPRMDRHVKMLLGWLRSMQSNSSTPPERRQQAFYIINFYNQHRNGFHLMAQILAMSSGELLAPQPSLGIADKGQSTLVKQFGKQLEDTVLRYGVKPTKADFEAHPFELFSSIPKALYDTFNGETKLELHKKMIIYERVGQIQLKDIIKRFGYHYVFRTGLREYYLTKLIAEFYNFLRDDNRGPGWRRATQNTFYELIDKHPDLRLEELRILISITQAFPYDVLLFRNWLISGRKAFLAMSCCMSIMVGRCIQDELKENPLPQI